MSDASGRAALTALAAGSSLGVPVETLRGRTVLISCTRQLPAVLALLQLDGIAHRVLLCPPDLPPDHVPAVLAEAAVDTVLSDGTGPAAAFATATCGDGVAPAEPVTVRSQATEWLLFTSGTTGRPKLVLHTLDSLAGPLAEGPAAASDAVWCTWYDMRRYGGLQVMLRALLGGGSLVLSQAGEAPGDFLTRAGRCGVTHILGTPSHWRGALMSQASSALAPRYVRLSGEVADQTILDRLRAAYPTAGLTHAFASTEAGVGFEVTDGLAGFPPSVLDRRAGAAEIRVVDGSLRIRSARTGSRYLGDQVPLADADGFVDTADLVEQRGDRYVFVGRREGLINFGGQKVYPEEVEAVLNRHPAVQMSRVRGRASPITGAIVVADLVLHGRLAGRAAGLDPGILPGRAAGLQGAGDAEAGVRHRHRTVRQAVAQPWLTRGRWS